jgi:lipopolysaccharide transport system ATP-binding protein
MQTIVQVRNLSKRYQLRKSRNTHPTLREALMGSLKWPWARVSDSNGSKTDTLWALRDVNFEVAPGEIVGIIGPNGAGKSTLLKILSRITKPSEGEVDIYGRVGSLLEIGTGFHPDLTGRENIFLNAAILGMKRAETTHKFDEIVDFSEVERFLDIPVKFYSSGMYLRLAFAVAVHLEPDVLILDEVLAVGDASFQKKCYEKMRQVHSEGRTVFFVSHNLQAIKQLCNRVFVVNGGRLTEGADMHATLAQYGAESPPNKNFQTPTIGTNSDDKGLTVPTPLGAG